MLQKSLKTVLDKVYFIATMYSFPLAHDSPRKSFLSPGKLFSPLAYRTTYKTPPPLDTLTTTLVLIFSCILSNSWSIQKNSKSKE